MELRTVRHLELLKGWRTEPQTGEHLVLRMARY